MLPRNIQQTDNFSLCHFRTAIFIPKQFPKEFVNEYHSSNGKRFVSISFSIPEDTTLKDFHQVLWNAYRNATRPYREAIIDYKIDQLTTKRKAL